jgi:hypothetical protein
VAPAAGGLLVKPPEITTFRPAVDGSGDAAIVIPPDVHAETQQVGCAVPDGAGQQLVGTGQHVMTCCLPFAAAVPPALLVGGGQQVGTSPRCCGQMMRALPAAPAGLSIAKTHNEAARKTSDDGTIRRRIADKPGLYIPVFVKANPVL